METCKFAFVLAVWEFTVSAFIVLKCISDRPANPWRSLETRCARHCHTPYLIAWLHAHHFGLRLTLEIFYHGFIHGWLQVSSSALKVVLSQVSTMACGLHLSVILKHQQKRVFMNILGSDWHHPSVQGVGDTGGASTCWGKAVYVLPLFASVCVSQSL